MHRVIFCFLIVFLNSTLFTTAKEKPDQLFAKGNQQYAKGNFQDAVTSYTQLVDSGYHSKEVYFNLANAYYKQDKLSSAILYYEKAYKLAPGDEDIAVNLQFANLKITDKIESVPAFFLAKWWQNLVSSLSLRTWSVIGVLLLILGCLSLVVYLFALVVRIKKVAFYTGLTLAFLGLASVFMASTQKKYFEQVNQAIVFDGSVDVKSGPESDMKTLFVIHEGLKVKVQERDGDWIKIEIPNGNVGWIEAVVVREI